LHGLQITTDRACYLLLGHRKIQHKYDPSSAVREVCQPSAGVARPLYQYIFPKDALENQNEMFSIFRNLFMGDECLLPFLDKRQKILSQKQMEAILGNELLPHDSYTGERADPGYWPGFIKDYSENSAEGKTRRGLLILPTGMGKTVTSAYCYRWMSEHWREDRPPPRLLFIAHRTLLLDSAEKTFIGINPELLSGHTAQISSKNTAHIKGVSLKTPISSNIAKLNKLNRSIHAVFITRQTLAKWIQEKKGFKMNFDFIIIDEAHHATKPERIGVTAKQLSDSKKYVREYNSILSGCSPRYLLGMTATEYANSAKTFDNNIIYRLSGPGGVDLLDAIRDGFLTRIAYREVIDVSETEIAKATKSKKKKNTLKKLSNVQVIYEQLQFWSGAPSHLEQSNRWQQIKDESFLEGRAATSEGIRETLAEFKNKGGEFKTYRKTIIYCQSQEHCMQVAIELNKQGVRSFPLISTHTDKKKGIDRKKDWDPLPGVCKLSTKESKVVENFGNTSCAASEPCIDVLCVKEMLDEGIDVPNIETIIFGVQTKNPITLLQRIGRGLRLSPGKRVVNIIDLVSNYTTWEDYKEHGTKTKILKLKSRVRFFLICKHCGFKNRNKKSEICGGCGIDLIVQEHGTNIEVDAVPYDENDPYILAWRILDDKINTFREFPTILEGVVKSWVEIDGLTLRAIVDKLKQEIEYLVMGERSELDQVATIEQGVLIFDDHTRNYDPEHFVKMLDKRDTRYNDDYRMGDLAVLNIVQPALESPTLADIAQLCREDDTYHLFFGKDKKGVYYDHTDASKGKCKKKTYDLDRLGCIGDKCQPDSWSMQAVYPKSMKAKLGCLKDNLEKGAIEPGENSRWLRYDCGLIGDQYDQKLKHFLETTPIEGLEKEPLLETFFPGSKRRKSRKIRRKNY